MLDIFDILGPVMIGPSSSHTAGAARIGAMARALLGKMPVKAAIHLYGSFAETGAGHGTDRALVGGLLGMKPDDPRLPTAFDEAEKAGLTYTIDEVKLRDAHPNTAVIETESADGRKLSMQASSIGGGRIMVNKLDGIEVNFNGTYNTLVIRNLDYYSSEAAVTTILSQFRINIANMSMYRHKRGGESLMIIEVDQHIKPEQVSFIGQLPQLGQGAALGFAQTARFRLRQHLGRGAVQRQKPAQAVRRRGGQPGFFGSAAQLMPVFAPQVFQQPSPRRRLDRQRVQKPGHKAHVADFQHGGNAQRCQTLPCQPDYLALGGGIHRADALQPHLPYGLEGVALAAGAADFLIVIKALALPGGGLGGLGNT